nr:hypothetical protein [uncultured Methanolobus sp.]
MSAESVEVRSIVNSLFGDETNIPVSDVTAYDIPLEFWQCIQKDITEYIETELQWTTLLRYAEAANQFEYYKEFSEALFTFLDLDIESDPETFFEKEMYKEEQRTTISSLNSYLYSLFSDNGLKIEADKIKKNQQQRQSMKKLEMVRDAYREYEEIKTVEQFIELLDEIDFPEVIGVDRLQLVYRSEEYVTYKKDVKAVINDSKYSFYAEVQRAEYTRNNLREAGYSQDEIDMYCPVDLEEHYDYIKNRSIFSEYKVTSKPKKVRDGSGWSYLWKTEGVTYVFNVEPPHGRPVSLMVHANMQILVWKAIVEDYPQYQEAYDKEFLKEPNFIPTQYMHLYKQYEKQVFNELKQRSKKIYYKQMELHGFTGVKDSTLRVNLVQLELCWNQPMPVNPNAYLIHKYANLSKIGLHPKLDAMTPLIVTEFRSDVDTSCIRFAHKEYRKSKNILRSEIIIKGRELKNRINLLGENYSLSFILGPTLSDNFLRNIETTKKYFYFKLYRRYQQVSGTLEHGYYTWRNSEFNIAEDTKIRILKSVLDSYDDLPYWIKEVSFFDSLVDQDFVRRSFFKNFTEMQFRYRVRENPELFTKIGRGKYRLLHPAVLEYRKVRNSLSSVDLPAIDELLTK